MWTRASSRLAKKRCRAKSACSALVSLSSTSSVSFVARSDASLEGQELGRLVFTQPGQTGELVSATCFDSAGAPVAGDVVRLSE